MFRFIIKIALLISFVGCINAFAAEYCSADTISDRRIEGIWEGRNIYYFKFRINAANKLCASIVDDNSSIERNIRDLVIIDGKLKHLSYFTPSTQAYLVYTNIEFKNDELNYYMFSSFDNRNGKDSLRKRKASSHSDRRTASNVDFSYRESYSFIY